jgi:ribosomal protein S18 acetylase RimI-like enzyme
MNDIYTLSLDKRPGTQDADFVREKLAEFNRLQVGDDEHQPFAIFLRNRQNAIKAGLLGGTYWGWLHIDILWVDRQIRGQGYGRKLLAAAEQEAIRRGCRYAHLDTMSFQARDFYEKQGYVIFRELKNLPQGHSRYYMKKTLTE